MHTPQVNMENQHVLKPSRELAARPQQALTLSERIDAIDNSFDEVERDLVHPSGDLSLRPVDIMPLVPDIDGWQNNYVQMSFDFDPSLAQAGEKEASPAPLALCARACIRT